MTTLGKRYVTGKRVLQSHNSSSSKIPVEDEPEFSGNVENEDVQHQRNTYGKSKKMNNSTNEDEDQRQLNYLVRFFAFRVVFWLVV